MDYVEWVERVAEALIETWVERRSDVTLDNLAGRLGLERSREVDRAFRNALADLTRMGLLNNRRSTVGRDGGRWRPTQEGEVLREASLRSAWSQVFDVYLTDEQMEFLRAGCQLSHVPMADFADMNEIQASAVATAMGQDWSRPEVVVAGCETFEALFNYRFVVGNVFAGAHVQLRPTYIGLVKATQQEPHEHYQLLSDLIAEGETASVDFKRELDLASERAKAEFVRDVLAFANSQLSGRRFILVGIADDGSEYADAPDNLTQERMEQILNAWAPPAPPVKARRVSVDRVEVLLVEVERSRAHLPYVATKSHGKLRAGVVYARHGTHTEPATPAEEAAIRAEGDAARNAQRM